MIKKNGKGQLLHKGTGLGHNYNSSWTFLLVNLDFFFVVFLLFFCCLRVQIDHPWRTEARCSEYKEQWNWASDTFFKETTKRVSCPR